MIPSRFPLGPRASLLLGILGGGSPLLATEIVALVERANYLDPEFLTFLSSLSDGDVRETLAALRDEGPAGIERLLERLESVGEVESVRIDGEPTIWLYALARRQV